MQGFQYWDFKISIFQWWHYCKTVNTDMRQDAWRCSRLSYMKWGIIILNIGDCQLSSVCSVTYCMKCFILKEAGWGKINYLNNIFYTIYSNLRIKCSILTVHDWFVRICFFMTALIIMSFLFFHTAITEIMIDGEKPLTLNLSGLSEFIGWCYASTSFVKHWAYFQI